VLLLMRWAWSMVSGVTKSAHAEPISCARIACGWKQRWELWLHFFFWMKHRSICCGRFECSVSCSQAPPLMLAPCMSKHGAECSSVRLIVLLQVNHHDHTGFTRSGAQMLRYSALGLHPLVRKWKFISDAGTNLHELVSDKC
jgi:hypothetical protein